jgi:hypothetical protein
MTQFLKLLSGQVFEIDRENLVVTTQESTNVGRPDLVISQKLDFAIFIEIKDRSGLGQLQLERYYAKLLERKEEKRQLILLTRSTHSMRQSALEKEKYRHLCWYQISNWLVQNIFKDEIVNYVSKNFAAFLEEKSMSLPKVTKEFTPGVLAMLHLRGMMEIALQEIMPNEELIKTDPWDSIGFYWTPEKNWLGIYYSEPQQIWLEKGGTEKPRPKLGLDLAEVGFFNLDGGQQLEYLIDFLDKGIRELKMHPLPIV